MSLTVVGSIAFDSVKTPFGERERMLGGTAVHFSLAASFFTVSGVAATRASPSRLSTGTPIRMQCSVCTSVEARLYAKAASPGLTFFAKQNVLCLATTMTIFTLY